MSKIIKNLAQSIRDRLLQQTRESNFDYNRLTSLYIQERFLYRLSLSKYKTNFILKGGVLFYILFQKESRPTRDIDFTGYNIKNDPEQLRQVIKEIVEIAVSDGLRFDENSIQAETIMETAEYQGTRIRLRAYIERIEQLLQIDIGFGDSIIQGPYSINYPTLLDNQEFLIFAYSWETVIAEKFQAIVKLSDMNSRMKDYNDIYCLQNKLTFAGKELSQALLGTFKNRNTDFKETTRIFSDEFIANNVKQIQWKSFLNKSKITAPQEFKSIAEHIKLFLEPVFNALIHDEEFNQNWDSKKQSWQ
ncbi:MAG TPA: nucleotidyl transferase AbiEii/AbiGii toxin family protein [bacterium]|nr:nucleotidyl transferase AbiEii/AbiGii toxin family protein [bacterium]HPN43968.1 nucleotidyl transferase AbiEii/AbiGii toxin family protein [bacterium]